MASQRVVRAGFFFFPLSGIITLLYHAQKPQPKLTSKCGVKIATRRKPHLRLWIMPHFRYFLLPTFYSFPPGPSILVSTLRNFQPRALERLLLNMQQQVGVLGRLHGRQWRFLFQ
jgi:hypothetical protein